MNAITFDQTQKMDVLKVTSVDELYLAISWWTMQRHEALAGVTAAWDMYSEAIDGNQSRKVIDDAYDNATMFERIAQDAWEELNTAKAALLARMN